MPSSLADIVCMYELYTYTNDARAHTLCVYILQPYANVYCLCKHEKNVGRDFFPHTSEGLVTINFDLERPLVDLVDSHTTSYFFNRDGPAWALAFSKAGFRPKRIRAGGRTNFKVKFISLRGVAVISVCVCVCVCFVFEAIGIGHCDRHRLSLHLLL